MIEYQHTTSKENCNNIMVTLNKCKEFLTNEKDIENIIQMKRIVWALNGYYEDLDSLCARLQEDYNGGKNFQQMEEDRLGLCFILDLVQGFTNDLYEEIGE